MTIARDHQNWKKDHKQWLSDHKKWRSGHKKILRTIKNLEKMINQHSDGMKKLGKSVKQHEKMMSKGKGKHVNSMHKKFKKDHRQQNLRHKLHHKTNQEIVQINKAIENTIRRFKQV